MPFHVKKNAISRAFFGYKRQKSEEDDPILCNAKSPTSRQQEVRKYDVLSHRIDDEILQREDDEYVQRRQFTFHNEQQALELEPQVLAEDHRLTNAMQRQAVERESLEGFKPSHSPFAGSKPRLDNSNNVSERRLSSSFLQQSNTSKVAQSSSNPTNSRPVATFKPPSFKTSAAVHPTTTFDREFDDLVTRRHESSSNRRPARVRPMDAKKIIAHVDPLAPPAEMSPLRPRSLTSPSNKTFLPLPDKTSWASATTPLSAVRTAEQSTNCDFGDFVETRTIQQREEIAAPKNLAAVPIGNLTGTESNLFPETGRTSSRETFSFSGTPNQEVSRSTVQRKEETAAPKNLSVMQPGNLTSMEPNPFASFDARIAMAREIHSFPGTPTHSASRSTGQRKEEIVPSKNVAAMRSGILTNIQHNPSTDADSRTTTSPQFVSTSAAQRREETPGSTNLAAMRPGDMTIIGPNSFANTDARITMAREIFSLPGTPTQGLSTSALERKGEKAASTNPAAKQSGKLTSSQTNPFTSTDTRKTMTREINSFSGTPTQGAPTIDIHPRNEVFFPFDKGEATTRLALAEKEAESPVRHSSAHCSPIAFPPHSPVLDASRRANLDRALDILRRDHGPDAIFSKPQVAEIAPQPRRSSMSNVNNTYLSMQEQAQACRFVFPEAGGDSASAAAEFDVLAERRSNNRFPAKEMEIESPENSPVQQAPTSFGGDGFEPAWPNSRRPVNLDAGVDDAAPLRRTRCLSEDLGTPMSPGRVLAMLSTEAFSVSNSPAAQCINELAFHQMDDLIDINDSLLMLEDYGMPIEAQVLEQRRVLNMDDPNQCTFWVSDFDGSNEHLELDVENAQSQLIEESLLAGQRLISNLRGGGHESLSAIETELSLDRIADYNAISSRNCMTPKGKKQSRRKKLAASLSFRANSTKSRIKRSLSFNSAR